MSALYTYQYDADYIPAMPVVEVTLGRAGTEPNITVLGLVDSGADATIVPLHFLTQLRARKGKQSAMHGVTGSRILVDLYQVSLQIGPFRLVNVQVVAGVDLDEVIVGRDVLNHFIVTLNGLASAVEVAQ